jgi:hypothetical protein
MRWMNRVVSGVTGVTSLFLAERVWAADAAPEPFSMWSYFQEGGWGMWWLLALGAVSFVAALRFAWRGEHQLVPFLKWMIATELLVGGFSFLSGMTLVLRYVVERVSPEERWWVLFAGTREALSNLTFGLLWSALTALTIAVGYRRFPELNPAALSGGRD